MRLHSISISILFDKKRISGKPFRNTYCPVGFTETKNQRSWLPRFRLHFNFIGQFVSFPPFSPTPCKFNVLLEYVKAIIKIILLDYFKEFHSLFTWRVFKSFFFYYYYLLCHRNGSLISTSIRVLLVTGWWIGLLSSTWIFFCSSLIKETGRQKRINFNVSHCM